MKTLSGSTSAGNTININNNTINNCNWTTATSGTFYGIYNNAATPATLNVNSNSFATITRPGTGAANLIYVTGTIGTALSISNNTYTNLSFATTGNVYFIYSSNATNNFTVNNNAISGTFTRTAAGTTYGFYDFGSPTGGTSNITNNNFSNITLTGASPFWGIYDATSVTQTKNINNNTVSNVTGGTSALYGVYTAYDAGTSVFSNNVFNISASGSAAIYGLSLGQSNSTGNITTYQNNVYNLSHSGASGIYGIYHAGTTTGTYNTYKNNIYNLSGTNTSSFVYGVYSASGTTLNLYNNYIGNLTTSAANAAFPLVGIYIGGGTTANLYYNTVYLNGSSSGALFGSSAVYASTSTTLDMRNNILVNTSTPVGATGFATAYRRSTTTLTSYAATSNNNDFYAPTVYYDGTTAYGTIAAYKALVTPRDAAAINENPPFVNTAASNFHINPAIGTQCESGAIRITAPFGITDDYDADIRWGETGYLGSGTAPDIGADEGNFTLASNMSYVSSTTTQVTGNAYVGAINQSIIRIEVVTTDVLNPLLLTQLTVNANGSTAISDINVTPAKIYYTGTTPIFSTASLFGSATPTIADFPVTGTQTLTAGTNYFWLAYDISSSATGGNVIDGECTGMIINSIAQTPTVTAPAGNKVLLGPLSGDYTISASLFNKMTGKNITFDKVTKKVMRDEPVYEQQTKDKEFTNKIIGTKKVEVEEISWIPMENGKKYDGPLYVKKSEHPELFGASPLSGVYVTITAAVNDVNVRGISAATRFLLASTSYTTGETYPITINQFTGASNGLIIKPDAGVTASISGSSTSSIFKLNGADYITFDGSNNGTNTKDMTISNTSASASTAAMWIASLGTGAGAINNTIKNCNISTGTISVATTYGIFAGGASIGTAGDDNDNLTIQNNTVTKAYEGIFVKASATGINNNLNINSNIVGSDVATDYIGKYGMEIAFTDGSVITQNTVKNIINSTVYSGVGIYFTAGTTNTTISRNTIASIKFTGTGNWGTTGLRVNIGTSTAQSINIENNFIYDITADGFSSLTSTINPIGILIEGTSSNAGINIYYNSVNMYGNTLTAGSSACLNLQSGITGGVNAVNNIFSNSLGKLSGTPLGASGVVVVASSPTVPFTTINNNDYYVNSNITNYVGYIKGAGVANLAAWQNATTGTGQDVNSISADPKFLLATNLHIDPAFNAVDNKAAYIASVLNDIDGDVRNTGTPPPNPDIGADEYVYVPPVLPVFSIAPLSKDFGNIPSGLSSADQIFTITNNGGANLVINPAPTIIGTDPTEFVLTDLNGYPLTIIPLGTAIVKVKFSPTSTGAKSASLQFIDNAVGSPHTVALTGTGTPAVTAFTLPYSENFDGVKKALADWSSAAISGTNEWVVGTPAKTQISAAHSAPNAYVTLLTGNTQINANEYVLSPLFNLTSAPHPMLSFWHNFWTELNWDACVVEYTTDFGSTWAKLDPNLGTGGNFNTTLSTNWYNNNSSSGPMTPPKFSLQSTAYTGNTSGWIHSVSDLLSLAGNYVQFRFRYASDGSTSQEGWAIDDFDIYNLAPMTYVSSTSTQAVTSDVAIGATNQQIIGVEVVTSGSASPLTASSFQFYTLGCTDIVDLVDAKLYYTGTSNVFTTTTLVGSQNAFGVTGDPFIISGSQALVTGTNYFWLAYDIAGVGTATPGDMVDAEIDKVTINAVPYTPSVINPGPGRMLTGNKSISSITVTQPNTTTVLKGSTNNDVLMLDFNVIGTTGTLPLNSIVVNYTGTNAADIPASGVKLYRTTTPVFSTANPLGTAQSIVAGDATFSSLAYDLPTGNTYIWAAFDVSASATTADLVDAQIAANAIDVAAVTYPAVTQNPAGSRAIVPDCSGVTALPYPQSFDGTTFPPDCWALVNAGTGNQWVRYTTTPYLGAACMAYSYNSTNPANAWAFTSKFNLISGKKYVVSFWQKIQSATFPEKLKVTVGTDQTPASQTTTLWDNDGGINLLNTTYIQRFAEYNCTVSGDYYFAFNCYSAANMFRLYVDEVLIKEIPPNDVGAYSVDFAPSTISGAQIPKATIKNYGSATQSVAFNTNMTINPGGYSSTVANTPPMISGATEQLSFASWTPTLGVLYTVKITTQLAGDGDVTNDTLTKWTTAYEGSWSSGAVVPSAGKTYMGSGCSYVSTAKATTGYIFSIGGNTTSALGTECYKYNVNTNTWSAIASLPVKRVVLASAVVGDFVYAIGGSDGVAYYNTVYKYDIALDTWTLLTSTLPKTIAWGKAVTYNGKIYLAGGVDAFTGGVAIPDVYVYDPVANTWSAATFMPGAKFGGAFSIVGNQLVYVAGADLSVISNTVYVGTIDAGNPLLITWATKANTFPGIGKEINITKEGNLSDVAVKPITKGKEDISGSNIDVLGTYPPGSMYRFDGAKWGATEMIVASGSPTSAWTPANPNPCYSYNPTTDTWTVQAGVPTPVLGASIGSVEIPGFRKLVVASGYTGTASTDVTQIYSMTVAAPLNLGLTAMLSGHCDGTNMLFTKNITVELRQAATPYTVVESQAATLSLTGTCNPVFTVATNGTPYWIVIKSNNGLETWSATTQTFTGSTLSYDFTTAATQAYGSNMLLVGTKWCIFSGDVDQDGGVGALDRSACWNDRNLVGVYATDLDGDGAVGASDRAICWNNRNKAVIKPALVASPGRELKQDNKGDKNNSKGTYDLRLDGSNSTKKVTKTK